MKALTTRMCRTIAVAVFLGAGAAASAHPGPPGHYHPDEVDEFDQVAMVSATKDNANDLNAGGILVLLVLGSCLGFALFQKQGGILREVTVDH